jgi:two-component system, NarL family, sensor kinase
VRRKDVSERMTLRDVAANAELFGILLDHGYRGVRIQLLLRAVLVLFTLLTVVFVPPAHDRRTSYLIVAAYALWAAATAVWTRRGGVGPIQFVWLALFVDLLALASLTLIAGVASRQSWTADVLVNGFFLIPMLAATQLRPWVCTSVMVPTVVVYLAASIATKSANGEPWSSVLLRTMVLAGLGVGCVALSRVQQSRVLTISRLAKNRSDLLSELMTIEARERRTLAEQLHDGALQYVLAARHDLDDVREVADPEALDRIDHALGQSSVLLRSTVAQLHPSVLEQAGLVRAIADLVETSRTRAGCEVRFDVDGWPEGLRTSSDALLFSTARELLSNVVKHAQARTARVELSVRDSTARLVVADDGRGIPAGEVQRSLMHGHIGVASHRARVEAAGGSLTLSAGPSGGTVAEVMLPVNAGSPALAGAHDGS